MKAEIRYALVFVSHLTCAQNYPVETVVQRGHTDAIRVLNFSRDGRFMVTGSDDHVVKLWDARQFKEIRSYRGHENALKAANIAPDNSFIISATERVGDATDIINWNMNSGKPLKTIETGSWTFWSILKGKGQMSFTLQAMVLSPDGEQIAWGEDNYGIKIGDVKKKMFDKILATNWHPNALAYSPDGKLLAAGGKKAGKKIGANSRQILFWKIPELTVAKTVDTPYDDTQKIEFSNDGMLLAYQSESKDSVRFKNAFVVRNMITDKDILRIDLDEVIHSFAFSGKGNLLAIPVWYNNTSSSSLFIYTVANSTLAKEIRTPEPIYALEFSPDGRLLIGTGNSIMVWNATTWELIDQIKPPARIDNIELDAKGLSLAVSKTEGKNQTIYRFNLSTLDFKGYNAKTFSDFKLWDFKRNSFLLEASGNNINQFSYPAMNYVGRLCGPLVNCTEISSFQIQYPFLVASQWGEPDVLIQNLESGQSHVLPTHKKGVSSFTFNQDFLFTGGKDSKIIQWDMKASNKVKEFLGHNNKITCLAISPDKSLLASGSEDKYVKIWNINSGERKNSFLDHINNISALAFSPTGKYLASGTGDPTYGGQSEIIQWDLQKQKSMYKKLGNDGYIKKILYHPDESCYFTIGNDPIIRAWDSPTGNPKFGIVPLDTNNYIIYTPDNYYTFTKSQTPFVHFVKGTQVFSLENFDLKFNRPDIILQRIGSKNQLLIDAYKKVYQRRLKKLGFDEARLSEELHTPEIEITNKNDLPLTTAAPSITIMVKAIDKKFPLDRLIVKINNVPVYGVNGLAIKKNGAFTKEIPLQLSAGKNQIQVSCLNAKGAESVKETLVVYSMAKDSKPDLYIIETCISKYENPARNLNYPVKDGQDFVSIFKNTNDYSNVIVDSLFNSKATRKNFLALKKKLMRTRNNDRVILHMAGHGILDQSFDFYFATYDLDSETPSKNGISYDDIEWLLDSIPARNKLVLIDACHSGELDKEEIEEVTAQVLAEKNKGANNAETLKRGVKTQTFDNIKMNVFKAYGISNNMVELMQELFTNLGRSSGAIVISAAAGNSYALESEQWKNGVFTYSLKEGLISKMADLNNDHVITANELKNFIVRRVFALTGGRQKPTTRSENIEFDFTVVK